MLSKARKNKIYTIEKDRGSKFYNQYEWAVSWSQKFISVLRYGLDDFRIEKALADARYWERQRWKNGWNHHSKNNFDDIFRSEITSTVVDNIYQTRNLLAGADTKRMISMDRITVYTSDPALRDQMVNHGLTLGSVYVSHANVIYPPDTVVLKNPRYKYRTYLRSREVSDQNIEILKNWLLAQQEEISASPGIKSFIHSRKSRWYSPNNWTADYFFFDHNDPKYVTMLRMVLPVAIRKTVPIIAK